MEKGKWAVVAEGQVGPQRMPNAAARWRLLGSRAATALLLGALATPASADPLSLILLRIVRDQVITRALEAAWEARASSAPAQPPASSFIPAPAEALDDRQIRQLIDDGFVHLSSAQRDEVYAGVQRILADPEHAASRGAILEELAAKGAAVRQAHDQLRQLTAGDKQRIAAQARAEYARLSEEDRQQLVQVLRAGLAPIPRDLSELILVEFTAIDGR